MKLNCPHCRQEITLNMQVEADACDLPIRQNMPNPYKKAHPLAPLPKTEFE